MRMPSLPVALAVLFAAAPVLCGQETRAETRRVGRQFESAGAGVTLRDEGVIYLIEDVRVKVGDFELVHAGSVVIWLADAGEGETPVRPEQDLIPTVVRGVAKEVYAEGSVLIRMGEEVHGCEAAFFDLVHDRGVVIDAQSSLDLPLRTGNARLNVKADELRFLSQNQIEAIGVRASTCPFGNPHLHVASERMWVFRERMPPPPEGVPSGAEPPPRQIFHYEATGNTLVLGSGLPVLWLPNLTGDSSSATGSLYRYVKDVRFRNSSQFGRHVGVTIGDDLEDKTGYKWGEWAVDLDWRSKRGFGAGVDFAYFQPTYFGRIKTYYQRDHGEDRNFGEPPTKNRGRISFQHRHFLPWELQLDLEANLFSDRGFYPTYYEDEFKGAKPPETYAYLKRVFDNSAVTGLFSARLNDWETVTEYRPRVDYVLLTEPLFDLFDNPIYFTTRAEVANVRRLIDEDLRIAGRATWRADVDNVVEYPHFLGPVKLTPFMGLRTTWYERDLDRHSHQVRSGFTYGGEASLLAWRNFDSSGGLFSLDGLRHIVEPAIEYRRTTGVNLRPDELVFYDPVDTFDDFEAVTFKLRNLFQTVRHRASGPAVDEIFDLDLRMSWFPDADRDNEGDPWGNLIADSVLRFSDELQLLTDLEWDPNDGQVDELNVAIGYAPSEEFQTYSGLRSFGDDYAVVFNQINWRLSEKWLARLYTSYDIERGESVDHDLVVSRIGHDWVFQVILRADYGENDYSVSFSIEPRVLFDPVLSPRRLRREPELQYLGTRIHK